ncbi:hypothetical protein NM208_g2103 [Fusarium decemcellulare]|uniref:Uncharacterized protein n=1 Tax=Fusarium decemcellulare TaxID=57161 RepID=A0ACC1SU09_9HYPO|nr:hypothetical protein NM208_g2103 [Fusarium decemcellulare]
MPELQKYLGVVYLWQYVPSLIASIVFTVLYALITAAHGWKMYKTRMWFCLPFFIGGVCSFFQKPLLPTSVANIGVLGEVLGYVFRAASWNQTGSLVLYIMQATFLLLPPVFFAASLYMVYSRLVRAVKGESCSYISPRWTTRIFVIGDFLTLNIQSNGAGLLANDELAHIGNAIVIAGLLAQVVLFIGFMICCFVFHRRFKAHLFETGATCEVRWQSCLHMLYWTSIFILVRNVFRVVEYIMDKEGYLQQKEWPTFVFDSVLMLLVMTAYYIWYPDNIQQHLRDSMIELMSNERPNSEDHERLKPEPKIWHHLTGYSVILYCKYLFRGRSPRANN